MLRHFFCKFILILVLIVYLSMTGVCENICVWEMNERVFFFFSETEQKISIWKQKNCLAIFLLAILVLSTRHLFLFCVIRMCFVLNFNRQK